MAKAVTFGEIMMRLSPEGHERLFSNDHMRATFGGAEANVAVSLANLGVDAAFVTAVPENPVGRGAIASLKSQGVCCSQIRRFGDRLGIYFMEKGAGPRPSQCVYDRAHSAIAEANPDMFDWDEILEGAEWFHFTGITPALSANCAESCLRAVKAAKAKGIKVSCDLNYRSKLWSREEASKIMSELCEYVDVIIANEQDAADVFGIVAENSDVEGGVIDKKGYESVAKQLADRFSAEAVAITLRTSISASVNDWSGMLYTNNECYLSKEYHIDIVDRVGAGDSFGAGLIYSMMNGREPQAAVDFAVAASALKHTIEGDFNTVSVKEVEALAAGNASGRIKR